MNNRKILLLMAARALEQGSEPEFAPLIEQLRKAEPPTLDGLGFRFMKHTRGDSSGGFQVSRYYLEFSPDHDFNRDFDLGADDAVEIIFGCGVELSKGTVTYDVTTGVLPNMLTGDCASKS